MSIYIYLSNNIYIYSLNQFNRYVWNSLEYFIALGKPAGHREVAPKEFDVRSGWKSAREAEEQRRRRRRRRRREDEDKAVKQKRPVYQVLAVATY